MMGLLAEIPIVSPVFQAILGAIGWILAQLYALVGNYGVAIILLTVIVRVVLLPLGIKQIRSMHNMQALQPKIKQLQQKYKGNKQRQQEEIMKLYRESGVNPLSGCWPVLLQFPILIAMYQVLRPPTYELPPDGGQPVPAEGKIHFPEDSELYQNVVIERTGTDFLWMNMECTPSQAGTGDVPLKTAEGEDTGLTLDCDDGAAYKIPYFLILALMIGSTFFQQRQMQRAAPPGATNPQQQALFKIMPIMFGIFGFWFPAGLIVYWTTSNIWQIGQQAVMLRLGHIGPEARANPPKKKEGTRRGLMARMADSVEQGRQRRESGDSNTGTGSKGSGSKSSSAKGSTNTKKPGNSGTGTSGTSGSKSSKPRSGGGSAGSRKKRPKR